MIVRPYKRRHTGKVRLAFVTPDGEYVTEDGSTIHPDEIDKSYRCFTGWETARKLTLVDGIGEMLAWHGFGTKEVVRWRPRKHLDEDAWVNRPSDAYVIHVPMHEDAADNLSALGAWRDWLWEYRVKPGTMGGTSLNLLKARLKKPLVTGQGWDKQTIRQSAGGIIRLGPNGQGEYTGDIGHFDLVAAYASELGRLRYGGRWHDQPNTTDLWLGKLARKGVPIYIRAQVYIPAGLSFGPLPIRPRKPLHPFKRQILAAMESHPLYPSGKRIQGVWTYEEICAARAVGCTVKILAAWHHSSPLQSPFAQWWKAIVEGREMTGLAGLLAKITGNSLWGMFALDPTFKSRRTITCRVSHRLRTGVTVRNVTNPAFYDSRIPAIDLAEIVAGRVRAKLYTAIVASGENLLSAHTDGLWAYSDIDLSDEWRAKDKVSKIQLLSPQHMRYWPRGMGDSLTMFSGVPYEQADKAFDKEWGKLGFA